MENTLIIIGHSRKILATLFSEGWREFVGTFSTWRNTYNLGIYSKASQVKIVNGIKVVMMLLIIYGHTLLYILGYPQFNPASLEEVRFTKFNYLLT